MKRLPPSSLMGFPPNLRRFARALKRVLLSVPGPENLHRKKIMERLKIKASRYYELRKEAEKNIV